MGINRTKMRWNGWGWADAPDPLSGNEAVWEWMASELGMGALMLTPAIPLEEIELPASRLSITALNGLAEIVGEEWVKTTKSDRASYARGKSYHDLLHLRAGNLSDAPDAVVFPANPLETLEIVQACSERHIALVPTGGGSSVVGGVTASPGKDQQGVVVLDTTRMGRVLTTDTDAMTAVVEAGAWGPELEEQLNEFGLTLGHYPQSFEFSTVGGWIAASGAGQQSSKFGRATRWLVGAKLATPKGFWTTECFPGSAAGPNLTDLVLGSEGTIGVITEATVRVQKKPQVKDYRGYLFKSFADGVTAARRISQAKLPVAMVRLSDADETHFFRTFSDAQKKKSFGRSIKKAIERQVLKSNGVPDRPCVMIIGIEGHQHDVDICQKKTAHIAKSLGAMAVGKSPGTQWYQGRFHGPYARDPMLDHGLGVDTLETSTRWSNIANLHETVLAAIDKAMREGAPVAGTHGIVMSHISHTYVDGASLYFTFVFPRDLEREVPQWLAIKKAATETIVEQGGTISHHHGVGTDHAAWLIEEKGPVGMNVLRAIKTELDANGVMNPGKLISQ